MSKKSNSATMTATNLAGGSRPEYQLKHRIAGAIVLMALAVVVIPLFLSEPSLEASNNLTGSSGKDFQSRIVPLNINSINKQSDTIDTAAVSSSNDSKVIDDTRPALLDLTQADEAESGAQPSQDKQSSALVMTAEDEPAKQKPAILTEPDEPGTRASDAVVTEADEPAADVPVASAAPAAGNHDSGAEIVKDGWVVRVGTYSKDANVVSVSSLLSNSGYQPNKTPVSTSLGPSTRVWLGPFAKRETADEISDRLKTLTGEKGYVTRTSS